jgi:hypothetical protein
MMKQRALNVEGGIVTWRCGASSLEGLRVNLASCGHLDLAPEPRTPKSALKAALAGMAGKDSLVRPLEKECGFTIVREQRGAHVNHYDSKVGVSYNEEADLLTVEPHDRQLWQQVDTAFQAARKIISPVATGGVLVKAIEKLNGIGLREQGGVYWIPEAKVATLEAIAEAVESSAEEKGKSAVYLLRTLADASAMRAVRDGIETEVRQEIERLTADIDSGTLGRRALVEREKRAQGLGGRLAEYETILGEALVAVRGQLDACQLRASEAALLAASENKA